MKKAVFLDSIILHIWTREQEFFMENIMEYIAHAQTVCTRPLLGGEGPGDEAKMELALTTECTGNVW